MAVDHRCEHTEKVESLLSYLDRDLVREIDPEKDISVDNPAFCFDLPADLSSRDKGFRAVFLQVGNNSGRLCHLLGQFLFGSAVTGVIQCCAERHLHTACQKDQDICDAKQCVSVLIHGSSPQDGFARLIVSHLIPIVKFDVHAIHIRRVDNCLAVGYSGIYSYLVGKSGIENF